MFRVIFLIIILKFAQKGANFMDQEKIGKFIAENRKKKNLTQLELAEKLGVTDRTISNWENGKNMPDLALFKPLCDELGITINELMSGEKLNDKKYNEKLEENIINTIDYIDKKNERNNDINSLFLLVISIIIVCLLQFIFNDYTEKDYVTIICLILIIYSLKQFFMKYLWVRRLLAIIICIICLLTIVL